MVPETLLCPRCGNTCWFQESALRFTLQRFEIPEGGTYDEAERHGLDHGEESFPLEIFCDAASCRLHAPGRRIIAWRHPNFEAAERMLAGAEALLATTGQEANEVVAPDPGGYGAPGDAPDG